jgi:hypothetical protein
MDTAQPPDPKQSEVERSPVTLEDLELLMETLLFTDEDIQALRMSTEALEGHIDAILEVWFAYTASFPHLLHFFTRKEDGRPDGAYLAAVRKRFGRWILETAAANFDQAWLDRQHEIGLRHHRSKKNRTDDVESVEHINFRYLPAFIPPLTTTLRPFLAVGDASAAEVERMHAAWVKAITLHVILWSYPYVKDGDF